MSLLMDALKRAERARQAEAERAKAEGLGDEPPRAPELSLDPMEDVAGEDEVSTRPAEPVPPMPAAPGTDTEDSLELTPPEVKRAIEEMDDPVFQDTDTFSSPPLAEPPPEDAPPPRQDSSLSLSLEYGDVPLDETGATLPSMRAAQRSVQDYFDGTHSMSLSMEQVQDAIAAERDGAPDPEDGVRTTTMDGDTTSRRQAQAVLDARAVAPSHTGRNIAVLLLFLLLIGGVSGGAWMYKDRLMAMVDGQSSVVVNQPPRTAPPPRAPAPAPTPSVGEQPSGTLASSEREALLRAAEAARQEEQRLAAQRSAEAEAARTLAAAQSIASASDAAAAAASTGSFVPGAPAGSARGGQSGGQSGDQSGGQSADPDADRSVGQSDAPDAAAPVARAAAPVVLQDVLRTMDASVPGGSAAGSLAGIRISKRSRGSRTHATLVQAFDAFQRGDDVEAMTAYQKVLAREPRNRDAMLGAAAVLMRSGQEEAATRYYGELLRMNPRDSAAQAALIALQSDLDPTAGESHVKGLLERAPEDANLHFTLGNLYAEQGRWPEAQQAYFEAYRRDSENPDHAFNLAVSLDRMAKPKAASDFYRRAMELSARRPAAFETAAAARRLAALAGS